MAVTRADTITVISKTKENYSDFLDSFAMSPFSGQLATVKNENSVNQALKNLIKTNRGERFFNPGFGSDVDRVLFELDIEESLEDLEEHIINAITIYEPRAQVIEVSVKPGAKSDFSLTELMIQEDRNLKTSLVMPDSDQSIEITIVYSIINNSTPITVSFLLRRVR